MSHAHKEALEGGFKAVSRTPADPSRPRALDARRRCVEWMSTVLLLGVLLWASGAGCRSAPAAPTAPAPADTSSADGASTMTYLGRFAFVRPSSFQLTGAEYSLHDVDIGELRWPEDTTATEAFEAHWAHMVAEVRAESFRGVEPVEDVLVEQRNLGDGLRVLLYRDGYAAEKMTWVGLLRTDVGGVRLQRETWAGEEEADLKVLGAVAHAYEPTPELAHTEQWFHVWRGGFRLYFEEREAVYARFVRGDAELSIAWESLREAPRQSAVRTFLKGAWSRAFGDLGSDTTSLRDRRRVAAGREGHEEILRFTEDGTSQVFFSWHAPGRARSGMHPRMDVELVAPASQYERLLTDWERILTTLRPLDSPRQ